MTITEIEFENSPSPEKPSPRNTLFQMRRYVKFQMYDGPPTGDPLGAFAYQYWKDSIVGSDGNGVACDIQTPHPDDIMLAAQMQEVLTHTILVRYDPNIDPRMIIKYTNQKTGAMRYWYIVTMVNPDFEWLYLRIGAVEIVEFAAGP